MKKRIVEFLKGLSFRTGVVVLCCCVAFYLLSFLFLALPLPIGWRGALWTIFFGLAKAAQYSGLLIVGKEGMKRLRRKLRKSVGAYE